MLAVGFTVSQVVHVYGDICQAVTALALAQQAPITTAEFHTLNRCLDTAIAEAVTEHARLTALSRLMTDVAQEIRDLLNTVLMTFDLVKHGTVAINGSTSELLGQSLTRLRGVIDGLGDAG